MTQSIGSPQRIAAPDAGCEGEHAGLVDAEFDRLVGRGGQRDEAPVGIQSVKAKFVDSAQLYPKLKPAWSAPEGGRGGKGGGEDHDGKKGKQTRLVCLCVSHLAGLS